MMKICNGVNRGGACWSLLGKLKKEDQKLNSLGYMRPVSETDKNKKTCGWEVRGPRGAYAK